jgi:hypothetical protein
MSRISLSPWTETNFLTASRYCFSVDSFRFFPDSTKNFWSRRDIGKGSRLAAGGDSPSSRSITGRKEAEPFLIHMRQVSQRTGLFGALRNVITAVTAIPKLLPLALDVVITLSLISALGLTQGVMGATVGLAMSNAIAYFIRREMRHFRPASK